MAACNTRAVHDLQSETCRELLAGKVPKQPPVSFQPSEILAAAAAAEAIDGEGAQALSENAEDQAEEAERQAGARSRERAARRNPRVIFSCHWCCKSADRLSPSRLRHLPNHGWNEFEHRIDRAARCLLIGDDGPAIRSAAAIDLAAAGGGRR